MSTLTHFRQFVSERLTSAAEEIFGVFEKAVIEYEKEIERQRKLLDTAWKPVVKLQEIELQQDVEEEMVPAELRFCNQESNTSLDREDPEPPQMKEEPCVSQLEVKQEQDTCILISTCPELDSGSAEAQGPDENQRSVVPEPDVYDRLLFHSSSADENQDHNGAEHGDPCSNRIWELYSDDVDSERVLMMSQIKMNSMSETYRYGFHTRDRVTGFSDDSVLEEHMRSHAADQQHSSKTCERHFRHDNEMESHMGAHSGEKPYTCTTCGKTFTDSFSLSRHTRVHTGEKPYTCTTCGRRFRFTSNLTVHMRIHSGVKAYPCNMCGKRFNTSTQAKMHVRTHTGDRPYICSGCGKRFSRNSALRRHMVIHTGENPYPCTACGKRFNHRSSLTRHMRIHTGEKDYSHRIVGEGIM